jgi:hypothetical protein
MKHQATQRRKCQEKTLVGNVYRDGREAQTVARRISERKGQRVTAFRCQVCGKFHVGRPHKRNLMHEPQG